MKKVKLGLIFILTCILSGIILLTFKDLERLNTVEVMEEKPQKETIKIGVSMGTLKEERWLKDRENLIKSIKRYGGQAIIKNANNDDQDQIQQVRGLLNQGIDVLILVPNDHTKAKEAVKLAKEVGVKVISYDRLVLNSDVDVYISFDNESIGEKMGEAVVSNLKGGRVLLINGDPSDNNTRLIRKGYMNILQKHIDSGDIEIADEIWAEDWMQEIAFNRTNELLIEGEKIQGVIAGNDSLAGGAIRALAENRLAGKVYITGQDSDLDACQRIVEGTQGMTIYKSVEDMANRAAEVAVKLAKGEDLHIKEQISDGKFYVPYYNIEVKSVDKSNIDKVIIENNFHKREDIYRQGE